MKSTLRSPAALAILLAALAPHALALSDAETTAGRLVLRRFGDAVVAVRLTVVLRVSVEDRKAPPTESTVDINGTVVTPEGVTVTSLSAVDPKMIFESMRAQMGPAAREAQLDGSEVKALRLRLADGTEVPAKMLGTDPARDIALIGPVQPVPAGGRTFTFVDLREAPESATVLGDCFHLTRTGDVLQRTVIVRPGAIIGILERPNHRFLLNTDIYSDDVGCPVFDAQGRVLGIYLRLLVDNLPKGVFVVPSIEVAGQVADQIGGSQ